MKFLCLAYGDGKDWNALTKAEQDKMLEQDEVIRRRGSLGAAVETSVTTVTAWDGEPSKTVGPFNDLKVPLAGFSVIDAASIEEVVQLVAGTPCARAKGAIEIRPILFTSKNFKTNETVTLSIESCATPKLIYETLADASLIPRWAPAFADSIEHVQGTTFRVTKGNDSFIVDVVLNASTLTVDYLRHMADGNTGGAYIRVMPKPLGGSVVTMTVPVGNSTTSAEVAAVLKQELEALIKLV